MQLTLNLEVEEIEDIYLEVYNQEHINLLQFMFQNSLKKGEIKNKVTKLNLIDWYCKVFAEDLEITCEDLYQIAIDNGVSIVG